MTNLLIRFTNRHFFFLDLVALAIIPSLALALRLDGFGELPRYSGALLVFTLLGVVIGLLIFWRAGLYRRYWRYASADEVALIFVSVAVATLLNNLLFFTLRFFSCSLFPSFLTPFLPRSIPFIGGLLTLVMVGGIRFSVRLAEQWSRRGTPGGLRVLIIGAGEAGRMIAREIQNNPQLNLEPVGFIDDDPAKRGMRICNLPVLGDGQSIPRLVRSHNIDQAIIAIPSARGRTLRSFVELCETAGIKVKTVPGLYELLSGKVRINQIRNLELEDLLRREPVRIETKEVARLLQGKRVMVTGAGGSIGSEICRQVAQYGAAELILLGHGENSIFQIFRELSEDEKATRKQEDSGVYPFSSRRSLAIIPIISDIRDRHR
ncbi:MAG: polysaccharide biosynthesis protein, partial [Candidatus Hadarchaeum sp.]